MSVWQGGVWGSQQHVNAAGAWLGSLWQSERDSTALAIQKLLFSKGQQGLLLVPRPIVYGKRNLYEDSSGTIEDVVNGDPVGLGLDRHKGLALGPELVVGGDFSNGIPEVITPHSHASIEVENGRLKITLVGDNYGSIYIKDNSLGAGAYLVEFDYETKGTTGTGYSVRCPDTGGDYNVPLPTNTAGHFSGIITSPTDNQEIYIRGDNPTEPWFVDNISVRELPGNHLTQATSADRPTYGTDGSLHWLGFDGVSDHLTSPLPWVSMNHTVVAAIKIPSVDSIDLIGSGGTTANNALLQARSGLGKIKAHLWNSAGEGFSVDVALPSGSVAVLTQRATGTTLECRANLDAPASVAISGSVTDGRSLVLGSRDGTLAMFNEDVYGAIVVPYTMTDAQLEKSIRYLADRAEIPL